MNCHRISAPRVGATALCAVLAGCGGAPFTGGPAPAEYFAAYDRARDAGLAVLDAVAPAVAPAETTPYGDVLGPARMATGPCGGRYEAEALRARCAALASVLAFNDALRAEAAGVDPGPWLRAARRHFAGLGGLSGGLKRVSRPARRAAALLGEARASAKLAQAAPEIREMIAALREDAPRLYALERARRAEMLAAEDEAFLEAMDAIFDAARGRASPAETGARAAFDAATRRLAPMLARPAPGYGAASLFDVMDQAGAPLTAAEAAAMTPHLEAAEAALARFDAAVADWRGVAAALRDYDALLEEVDATLGGGGAAATVALFDRAGRIMTALGRRPKETME